MQGKTRRVVIESLSYGVLDKKEIEATEEVNGKHIIDVLYDHHVKAAIENNLNHTLIRKERTCFLVLSDYGAFRISLI